MSDVETRLRKCFEAVFPRLGYDQIPSAKMDNVEDWDSASTVMLVAVIEEEFGLQIDLAALELLLSFHSALEYLENVTGAGNHLGISSATSEPLETDQAPKITLDR